MEESVALDPSKQKQFVKSVRGIKKLLKKKTIKSKETATKTKSKPTKEPEPAVEPELKKELNKPEPDNKKKKEQKKKKNKFANKIKKRPKKGLVYLSHIPHGFYEHQMTEYFKQFGVVTNARVIRSRRTGNSKGYAFVEFKEPTVAEIVAETMNNYLMGKRLIKAVYVPPKKQKLHALRKHWNVQSHPASEQRLKMKKGLNADKTDQEELKIARKLLSTLSKTKEKLSGLGIEYDFFVPVDVPEALIDKVPQNDNEQSVNANVELKKKIKSEGNVKKEQKSVKNDSKDNQTKTKDNKTIEVKKENKKNTVKNEKQQMKDKKKNVVQVLDKKQQKIKQQKLNEKGMKGPENFININDSNDDSDSSDGFDSDEFEKMIENDDELSSGDGSDVSGDGGDESDDKEDNSDTEKELIKPVNKTEEGTSKVTVKHEQTKQGRNKAGKRKNVMNASVGLKKAKFEKQNKKTLNKVMKKRK